MSARTIAALSYGAGSELQGNSRPMSGNLAADLRKVTELQELTGYRAGLEPPKTGAAATVAELTNPRREDVQTDDGRELLVTLAYPLPLSEVPSLLRAVRTWAEECSYTDVRVDDQGRITARANKGR